MRERRFSSFESYLHEEMDKMTQKTKIATTANEKEYDLEVSSRGKSKYD